MEMGRSIIFRTKMRRWIRHREENEEMDATKVRK